MKEIISELLGTAILVLLGNGVVAGTLLNRSKGKDAGWVVITTAWGLAVAIAVFIASTIGPAHLNPAVTIAIAVQGGITWTVAFGYIVAQLIGAAIGACLVYLHFKPHYDETEDTGAVLATFATGPAIRNTVSNFIGELIGTFVLVFTILCLGKYHFPAGVGTFAVGALVIGIGMSLGGTTGYAINPARDLAPRFIHALLPLKHKGTSDWEYAWIPVIAPIVGGVLAAIVFGLVI